MEDEAQQDRTLVDLFKEGQQLDCQKIATIYDDGMAIKTATFEDLQLSADKLAGALRSHQCSHEVIGVCVKPTEWVPAQLVGVMQTPAGFHSIDVTIPPARLAYLIHQIHLRLILVDPDTCKTIHEKLSVVGLGTEESAVPGCSALILLRLEGVKARRWRVPLAYVITTSGTTGMPKVVRVPHRSIVPNIIHIRDIYQLTSADIVYQASPLTFDPSIVEIFTTLSRGGILLTLPEVARKRPAMLAQKLAQHKTTILQATPSLMRGMGAPLLRQTLLSSKSSLRVLALGGETCPAPSVLASWRHHDNHTTFFNLYGITEVSSWATWQKIAVGNSHIQEVPLGQPLEGTDLQVRGQGDCGDLWIGSASRICFVDEEEDRLPVEPVMRASGDWVRKDKDGELWYLGRRDDQIKRHGKRVNIEELEKVAQAVEGVRQAVAVVDGNRFHLCVSFENPTIAMETKMVEDRYQQLGSSPSGETEVIMAAIRETLPSYYVPDAVHVLRLFPITRHGKVDKSKLLALLRRQREGTGGPNQHSDPAQIDATLRHIWKTYLNGPDRSTQDPEMSPDGANKAVKRSPHSVVSLHVADKAAKSSPNLQVSVDGPKCMNDIKSLGNSNFIVSGGDSFTAVNFQDAAERAFGLQLPLLLDKVLNENYASLVCYVQETIEAEATLELPEDNVLTEQLHSGTAEAMSSGSTDAVVLKRVHDVQGPIQSHKVDISEKHPPMRTDQAVTGGLGQEDSVHQCIDIIQQSSMHSRGTVNETYEVKLGATHLPVSARMDRNINGVSHRHVRKTDGPQQEDCIPGRIIPQSKRIKLNPELPGDTEEDNAISGSDDEDKAAILISLGRGARLSIHGMGLDFKESSGARGSSEGESIRSLLGPAVKPYLGAQDPEIRLNLVWRYYTGKCVDASPLIVGSCCSDAVVYIGSHSHKMAAICLADGSEVWSVQLGGRVESSACLSRCGRYIIVGCYDHAVYVLHAHSGKTLWKFSTRGEVKCSAAVDPASGLVYVGSHDQYLYCLDIQVQSEVWRRHLEGGSVFSSPCISSSPHQVYAATLAGILCALQTQRPGNVLWTVNLGKPVFSSPACTPQGVCVACVDNSVNFFTHSGQKLWWFETTGPVFSSPCLYPIQPALLPALGGANSQGECTIVESRLQPPLSQATSCSTLSCILPDPIPGGFLPHKTADPQCIEKQDPEELKSVLVNPAIDNHSASLTVIGCHDNHVYCLSPEGKLRWMVECDSQVYSTPYIFTPNTSLSHKSSETSAGGGDDPTNSVQGHGVLETDKPKDISIGKECNNIGSSDLPLSASLVQERVHLHVNPSNRTDHSGQASSVDANVLREITGGYSKDRTVGLKCFASGTSSTGVDSVLVSPELCGHANSASVTWCSTRGTLYVADLANGCVLATYSFPGQTFSSPVVWGNCIVVGCRDDFVYCVKMTEKKGNPRINKST